MQVEMDPEETIALLWQACDRWSERAECFETLADAGFPDGSRLHRDNASATVGENSLAVSRYVQERMRNAVRMLRALHRHIFKTKPGRFHLDATVLYPLMRAAIEDATTIVWLQASEDQKERHTRVFRALFTDSLFFTENHLLLATAAPTVGAVPTEMGDALSAHMSTEKAATQIHFERLAGELGLDASESMRKLATSAPVQVQYGKNSVEFATWKFLSDLSHFSFMMLRHLATTPIPGTPTPLLHATMLQFAQTVNRVCSDATKQIEQSASISRNNS